MPHERQVRQQQQGFRAVEVGTLEREFSQGLEEHGPIIGARRSVEMHASRVGQGVITTS